MKILAIKARRLGDTVIWTSALEALSSLHPDVLDIAYPEIYRELFHSDPRVHEQFLLKSTLIENLKWRHYWKKKKYDWVIAFHASGSSRLLALSASAKNQVIHFHNRPAKKAWGSAEIPNLGVVMSAIERDLNAVRALGWQGSSPSTKIYFSKPTSPKARIVFGLGASRVSKLWPLEYFVKLAKNLSVELPGIELAFNYESEEVFARNPAYKIELSRYGTLSPTQNLKELMALLSNSQFYIGSDSGVKHLAIALGLKSLTLFGPESIGEWHGYRLDRNPALQIDLTCRDNDADNKNFAWCGAERCPHGSHACMNLLLPEEVVAVVKKTL